MKLTLPKDLPAATLASICEVSEGTIYRAIGEFDETTLVHTCGAPLASRLHWATGGRVAAWQLRPDIWREGQVPPNPFASPTLPLAG